MFKDFEEKPLPPSDEPRADYIRSVLADVSCGASTRWAVNQELDGTCSLRVHLTYPGRQYTGYWFIVLSNDSKKAILDGAFQAIVAAFSERLRDELFLYKNVPVFKLGENHKKLLED